MDRKTVLVSLDSPNHHNIPHICYLGCPHFLVLKHVNCYQWTGTRPDARTKAKAEIIILRTHSLTLSLPLPSYQTFQNFLGSFAALNHIYLSVSQSVVTKIFSIEMGQIPEQSETSRNHKMCCSSSRYEVSCIVRRNLRTRSTTACPVLTRNVATTETHNIPTTLVLGRRTRRPRWKTVVGSEQWRG